MTVPGGKIAAAPAARSASKSCGGMTPPTTTRMSSRPSSCERRLAAAGTSVRWPAASVDTPTTCTSASTAWRATSSGVWNSGPTSTSKPRSANAVAITFWPRSWPSWPILATRMRGRRPCGLGELVDERRAPASTFGASPTSLRYTPVIVRIAAVWRPNTFSSASLISPTVALRAGGVDRQLEQVLLGPGARVPSTDARAARGQGAQRVVARGLVALGAQALAAWRAAGRAPPSCRP